MKTFFLNSNRRILIIMALSLVFAATSVYAATTITSDGNLTLTPAGNVVISNGNLGIGTATPINDLTVISSANDTPTFFSRQTDSTNLTAGYIWIEANNPSPIANTFANIAFTGFRNSDGKGAVGYAWIDGIFTDHAAVNGDLAFLTRNNNNPGERMRILSNGNIGIGTSTPTSKLQVIGLPVYANNAAAIAGGLTAGAFYRTGGDPDPLMVVH